MSEFAFFHFTINNMLTREEQQHKDEIVSPTEQVLDAKGMNVIQKYLKYLKQRGILVQVRKLRRKRRMRKIKIRKSSLTLSYNSK